MLIGWELGAGRGHVERLVPLVRALRERGWRVVTALRDALLGAEVLGPPQAGIQSGMLEIVRAPIFSHTEVEDAPVASLADVLAKVGFATPRFVQPVLNGWQALIERVRPSIVISDSAPSLNVVVRGRIPLIVIGNGWTTPPESDAVPLFASGAAHDEMAARSASAIMTAMLDGRPASSHFAKFTDLLRGDWNFVYSLSETDPYHATRNEALYWPIEIPEPRPATDRHGGLIYLPKDHPGRGAIESIAGQLPVRCIAYFGDRLSKTLGMVSIQDQPINFDAEIPRRQFALHHGGLGTTIRCVVNRTPQLLVPADLEKMLIAKAVVENGFGYAASPRPQNLDFEAAISATSKLIVPQFATDRMATLSPQASIDALLSRCFGGLPGR